MDSLFGTDGIRSTVGCHPVTPESFLKLGWAIGTWLGKGKVLIGKDTRLSGYMLESALQAGLSAAGIDVYLTGPIPTPGIAYLTQSLNAQAGLVISASHNPYHDNGLKIFSESGLKLTNTQQEEITELYYQTIDVVAPYYLGKAHRVKDASGRYIEFLKRHFPKLSLAGVSVALDCAHGAAYQIAPTLYRELKADVTIIGDEPNGYNINERAGIMHLEQFEQLIRQDQPRFAFAFDGDADRLAVYINGERLNPNHILLALHDYYVLKGLNTGIVMTSLTNLGIEQYLKNYHIPYSITDVGDRHLIHESITQGWFLAGEPSGHFMLMDKLTTADALLTSLALIDYFLITQKSITDFEYQAPLYPSVSHNFKIQKPKLFMAIPELSEAVTFLEKKFGNLRFVLRASGTEPIIRFYAEGKDFQQLQSLLQEVIVLVTEYESKAGMIKDEKVVAA